MITLMKQIILCADDFLKLGEFKYYLTDFLPKPTHWSTIVKGF